MATRIFLSAGEPSGVHIAARLMRALRARRADIRFAGLGGAGMVAEGMRQIADPSETATMWLWGNLKRIGSHRRALDACVEDWKRERPDVLVTVDYQAFHLYVGTRARALGIPVVHMVGSQFWARRYHTLEPVRRAYSHVLLIHEFEKRFYDEAGIPATFIGHPLFERLEAREHDESVERRLAGRRLGVLPGSRGGEITGSLPVMLDAARALRPVPRVSVSLAHPASRPFVEEQVAASGLDAEIVPYGSGEILRTCDVALITSGSASMEAVYYGRPCAVVYRISPASYFFARPHIVCAIAQPNLVAGRAVVPEFLLWRRDASGVARAAQLLLDDEAARHDQTAAFEEIRKRLLAGPPPSEKAADVVLQHAHDEAGDGDASGAA